MSPHAWTFAFLLGLAAPGLADEVGRIRGAVVDEAGQVLPGVTIDIGGDGAA